MLDFLVGKPDAAPPHSDSASSGPLLQKQLVATTTNVSPRLQIIYPLQSKLTSS